MINKNRERPTLGMDAMTLDLLALLDRIETEEDLSLTSQRHDIAEKYGYSVSFGRENTARHQ